MVPESPGLESWCQRPWYGFGGSGETSEDTRCRKAAGNGARGALVVKEFRKPACQFTTAAVVTFRDKARAPPCGRASALLAQAALERGVENFHCY